MMQRNILLLILILGLLPACNADKLNKAAEKINSTALEVASDPSIVVTKGTSGVTSLVKDSQEKAASINSAADAAKEMTETYQSTKETISEVKADARETISDARRTVRTTARKLPRSQKEANKMVVAYGQKWMDLFKSKITALSLKMHRKRQRKNSPRKR